jgi:hypothetical protein
MPNAPESKHAGAPPISAESAPSAKVVTQVIQATPPRAAAVPWYRRNAFVTGLVAGCVFLGPIFAPFVLAIVLTGPVYSKSWDGQVNKWQVSTKVAVVFFSLLCTTIFVDRVIIRIFPSLPF